MLIYWVRYRIHAAFVPGMTVGESSQREPNTTQEAMLLQGFDCVARTTWIKTTVISEKRAQENLIGPNQVDQEHAHFFANLCQ